MKIIYGLLVLLAGLLSSCVTALIFLSIPAPYDKIIAVAVLSCLACYGLVEIMNRWANRENDNDLDN